MYTVCIITSTRADWGLLQPLAQQLAATDDIALRIVATNMHLMARYGMTAGEIEAAGFTIDQRVALPDSDDTGCGRAHAAAAATAGIADALERIKPDAVVLLGDRYEILAAATAAALLRIPIVHIAGGETTVGVIDDSMRHAITKLASLHLTATEAYRRRVIAMGEQPERVICTGAIGVWNVFNQPRLQLSNIESFTGLSIGDSPFALVTYHPATAVDQSPAEGCQAMLDAMDRFPKLKAIITYPNNDARSLPIIDLIEAYAAVHKGRIAVVPSLGMQRYISAASLASVVLGNSSSGVVEVPSTGTPTVDIGDRQRGRIAAESVIHCGTTTDEIAAAIDQTLSPAFQAFAARATNPYFRPNTPQLMVDAIMAWLPKSREAKIFYDAQL